MDAFEDWQIFGRFAGSREEMLRGVREWESIRVGGQHEWGLAVMKTGVAYERRGMEFRVSFHGLKDPEREWSILSHTHPKGFPPSIEDFQFLLNHRAGIRLRVARSALPAVELWRRNEGILTNAHFSAILREIRLRAIKRAGPEASEELRSKEVWLELMQECDNLGITWARDLEANM